MNTKTIFKMLAAAMLMPAMLLTTACSSDDDAVNDNANTQKKYYEIPVTVTVTRQGDEGTRAVYDSGTKTLSFSAGDKLFVRGEHNVAGLFAGVLVFESESDGTGTFSGTVRVGNSSYTGTANALLTEADFSHATLLPANYDNYGFLKIYVNDDPVSEKNITPNAYVMPDVSKSLLPLGKAEAVAQLCYEQASGYADNGNVFPLAPTRPVICCTISGLTANTAVTAAYGGHINSSGSITPDGSGTATFAFTDFSGYNLGTLTVGGNAITLPGNVQLEAGKVYNINRSVEAAPAAPDVTWVISEMSSYGTFYLWDGITYKGVTLSGTDGSADFANNRNINAQVGATFTAPDGKTFKRIVVSGTYARFQGVGWTVNDGNTCSTWTGSAESVAFTGQSYMMTSIEFYFEGDAAPASPFADVTNEDEGKLIGADGNIYDSQDAATAAGTTAVAMIAYVGNGTDHTTYTHGLAIALEDEAGSLDWPTAKSTCEGKAAVADAAWVLPSQNQWKAMFSANGGSDSNYSGLNTAITNAGGTALDADYIFYWSSTENGANEALGPVFTGWGPVEWWNYNRGNGFKVRACLAF